MLYLCKKNKKHQTLNFVIYREGARTIDRNVSGVRITPITVYRKDLKPYRFYRHNIIMYWLRENAFNNIITAKPAVGSPCFRRA